MCNSCFPFLDCGALPGLVNGNYYLQDTSLVGGTANVTCDTGYTPSQSTITCLTGFWSTANCNILGKYDPR